MKAVVYHDIGDIRLEDVPEPKIEDSNDAVVRITGSAICGTDLHMVRGTMPGMEPGTILGHEGVGIVEDKGRNVRNFDVGDRVVIGSTIGCGYCSYCRAGYFSQCDNANPNGPQAGTAFFGGPKATGSFHGLQAEMARVPFANVGMVKIADSVTDEQALMLSDIFPTGYFGADLAHIHPGSTVSVFGCGPVGQFAIISSLLMGAGRVLAVDCIDSRLQKARENGAETINFEEEDVVEAIQELTGGIGTDRAIDAVGIDAIHPHSAPAVALSPQEIEEFDLELQWAAPELLSHKDQAQRWQPGDAPSQALQWAVQSVAKRGSIAVIGVYPESMRFFPLGKAMMKNLTIRSGNCNHRKYIPTLMQIVSAGSIKPERVITQQQPIVSAIDAYRMFAEKKAGWMKIELRP
ncbi:MAG: glutathione-dependent formaldehyde dehydrogenase [Planctomycetes bacterium]|nr:glutathione-dependent formaldehyde dehydrogenase [Planctomycetota bacterium]